MNIIAQCCGLVIMLVVLYFDSRQKKLYLFTKKAFMGIWNFAMLALLLDIVAIITIYYRDSLPRLLVDIVNKGYLVSIVVVAIFAIRYVCVDALMTQKVSRLWAWPLYGSCLVVAAVVSVLPIEYVEAGYRVYSFGPAVTTVYIINAILYLLIILLVIRHRETINPRRRVSVLTWGGMVIVAALIQFWRNDLLLVSFVSSIGMLFIFLMVENPEVNIDRETGFFNLSAFIEYMRQRQNTAKDVSIICLSINSNSSGVVTYEMEHEIYDELLAFMGKIPHAIIFRSSSTEFLLVFNKESYAEKALELIEERFEQPWGTGYRTMAHEWFFMESTEIVKQAVDVLPIIQYIRQNKVNRTSVNGVRISSEDISEMYLERKMENEILNALAEDRVEVFYQPIFSTKDKLFQSAEALVRIRDRQGEIISPGLFIPIAEKRGLIINLGEKVFELVCDFIVNENPGQYGIKYIEVNLSTVQCADENLADDFIRIMKKKKVDPTNIVLEITESASIQEKTILLENMRKLKEVGVRFALDDFGTGQSNLNYIVEMPVDVVKFDSSMTNAYFENGTAKYVMDAAMQMIQGLELEIVSEGIEEKVQYHTMRELGIDYIQGYYFSQPVKADEFISFIKEVNKK